MLVGARNEAGSQPNPAEFKHLLDYTAASVIHANLGQGDRDRQRRQIEQIADHFASNLLMPKLWVRRAWTSGIQNPDALAGLFNASTEAINVRLHFGYLGDSSRPLKTYFREAALVEQAA